MPEVYRAAGNGSVRSVTQIELCVLRTSEPLAARSLFRLVGRTVLVVQPHHGPQQDRHDDERKRIHQQERMARDVVGVKESHVDGKQWNADPQ